MEIKFLNHMAKIPTRGSEYAAGLDLYAAIESEVVIPSHETRKIGTGLAMAIPDGYFGAIFARSGLATKQGIRPSNCVGAVDSDYRGEVIVPLHNDGSVLQTIHPGDRIAQMIIMPYEKVELEVVKELDATERGNGGFGSTGTN